LARGSVKDGCIVCPYHGWRYGGDGKCQRVPSLDQGSKIPARAKVDSYPVQERYGIVFAFLGDLPEQERPPLYEIQEYNDPKWRSTELMVLEPACYYERSLENGMDPVHNEFVHPIQGSPQPNQGNIEYLDLPWGSKFIGGFTEQTEKPTDVEGLGGVPEGLSASSEHYGPNTLITWINFKMNKTLHQYFFEAPIDGDRTKIFFINLRNFLMEPDKDKHVRDANLRVTVEDITVLEGIYPTRTPDTNTKEILTPGDEGIVRYRNRLKEWAARGWRLDTQALQQKVGDVAYAIPCPDRRSSGNWVLDPVPLIPPIASSVESAA
jgi:phenylpropionate dioxygenase-like ring-hydroxylating dioxygenase large terminal subunit